MTAAKRPRYRDRQGARLLLGASVGQGGEAVVHEVKGRPETLAKIYHATPAGYEVKLAWMVGHPPVYSGTHVEMAWPTDLVFDKAGALKGYLMPRVRGAVPLLTVFNPRKRAQVLPDFDRRYRYRAARNLAAAVQSAHDGGYVVGDLNESNALVTGTALVSLLDTDSFQVRVPHGSTSKTFRSPVGKPEYTPPELQGLNLRATDRRVEHDRFALGVLLFQLLMDGNHPFRHLWRGSGEPPTLENSIHQGWFPHAGAPPIIAPPPGAPSMDTLDPALAYLFKICFGKGQRNPAHRPTAGEWQRALATAEMALRPCSAGHIYSGHLTACPDCTSLAGKITVQPTKAVRPKKAKDEALVTTGGPPPPPIVNPPSPSKTSAPLPQPTTQRTSSKKWPGWLRWAAGIIVLILLRNALVGDGAPSPTNISAGTTRATATARARSTFAPRTPTPAVVGAADFPLAWGFMEDFLDSSGFEPVNAGGVRAEIENGRFGVFATPGMSYGIDYPNFQIDDRDFGLTAGIGPIRGNGEIFLKIRSLTTKDDWYFAVNPWEESWQLFRDSAESNEPFVWIVPQEYPSLGELRSITIRVSNGEPLMYINGADVVTSTRIEMPELTGSLIVGFGAQAAPETGSAIDVKFDNFKVYEI